MNWKLLNKLARELGFNPGSMRRLAQRGVIKVYRLTPGGPLFIDLDEIGAQLKEGLVPPRSVATEASRLSGAAAARAARRQARLEAEALKQTPNDHPVADTPACRPARARRKPPPDPGRSDLADGG